jgi:CRP-like cAMP-binding protein
MESLFTDQVSRRRDMDWLAFSSDWRAEYLNPNDKVLLYAGEAPLTGSLYDEDVVSAHVEQMNEFLREALRPGKTLNRRGSGLLVLENLAETVQKQSRTELRDSRESESLNDLLRAPATAEAHPPRRSVRRKLSKLGDPNPPIQSVTIVRPPEATGKAVAAHQPKPGSVSLRMFPALEEASGSIDLSDGDTECVSESAKPNAIPGMPFRGAPGAGQRKTFSFRKLVEPTYSSESPSTRTKPVQGAVTIVITPRERRAMIKEKLRRAVRRLVSMHRMEQAPPHIADDIFRQTVDSVTASVDHTSLKSRKFSALGLASKQQMTMDSLIKEESNIYQYNEIRKGVKDDMIPCTVIHPDSIFRLGWDLIMLCLVLTVGYLVPVRLGFDIPPAPWEEMFGYITDSMFLLDMALNFRTAFKDDGILVTNSKAMALNYARSWFLIDFVASFPIGWFTDSNGVNRIIRLLRLFKMVRMLRLLRLFPRFTQVLESSIKFNPSMIRFLRSIAIMCLMWHSIGCIYWFVAREELGGIGQCPEVYGGRACFANYCVCDLSDPSNSIVVLSNTDTSWYDPMRPDLWVPHYSMSSATFGSQYAQAVFWAVQVTTGIGADIPPRSQLEVFFTCLMVIVGLMMYSIIIGSASSALANIDSTATHRRQTLDKVNAFMRSRKVPTYFQRIIVDFYEHMWQSPQQEADVFKDLPHSLRSRLAIVMNRDLIERIPIFRLLPAHVYVRLVLRLQQNTFLPGEFVIKQGTMSEFLFFIKRGKADALLPNTESTVYMTMFPGSVFGEQGLLHSERRRESFRAVDFLDVLMMTQTDLHELMVTAPQFVFELRRLAAIKERRRLSFELTLLRRNMRSQRSSTRAFFPGMVRSEARTQSTRRIHEVDEAALEWREAKLMRADSGGSATADHSIPSSPTLSYEGKVAPSLSRRETSEAARLSKRAVLPFRNHSLSELDDDVDGKSSAGETASLNASFQRRRSWDPPGHARPEVRQEPMRNIGVLSE